ncbi:MAG: chemotaxis protein CheW [Desulfamplus sp.]|nr:chemotaxis protein CheW [Desulfamplus sp.]
MMDQDELIKVFVEESIQHLESIEPDLLEMEKSIDNIDSKIINGIFRAVHSIKGASGFFGLQNIGNLSHVMENLLSLLREGNIKASPEFIDALFSGIDALRAMFDDIGNSENFNIQPEIDRLTTILNPSEEMSGDVLEQQDSNLESNYDNIAQDYSNAGQKISNVSFRSTKEEQIITVKEKTPTGQEPRTFDVAKNELDKFVRNRLCLYTITVYLKKDLTQKGKTPLDLINSIVSNGDLIESRLDIDMIQGLSDCLDNEIKFVFAFATFLEEESLPNVLGIPKERIIPIDIDADNQVENFEQTKQEKIEPNNPNEIKPGLKISQTKDVTEESKKPKPQIKKQQQFTPPIEPELKISKPKDVTEESNQQLEITKQQQSTPPIEFEFKNTNTIQTEEKIKVGVNFLNDLVNLAGEMVLGRNQLNQIAMPLIKDTPGLNSAIQHISRITTEMQEKIMQMRMQPVSMIFGKFQRIVRDLAKQLNKEIRLVTYGEDVELDKSIIEALSDPLTHLIRNSVDHGIEQADYREKSGKPRQGTIQLKAYHQAGHVYIDIIDDGSGINCKFVGEKAVEKEIITKEQMSEMGEKELMMLIFKPGFSTAKQVSAVSGRGVGMDVVMTNIKQLGGTVDINSTLYEGTTISLVLPLTLAIVSGLVIQTGGQCFILPQANIDELVLIDPDEIKNRIELVQKSLILRLRNMLLPLISLKDVLNINDNKKETIDISSSTEPARIIVIKHGTSQFGLLVDAVENIEEIVVKPLPRYLKSQKCFSGASIMGNGSVSLILDAAGIFEKAKLHHIDLEKYRRKSKAEIKHKTDTKHDGKDLQTLLLFNNNTPERFALPLELISRIERIKASTIEMIKDQQYLQYQGAKLRLVFLEDYLPITRPERLPDQTIGVIVPKQMKYPMGIIIHNVEGTINAVVDIDTKSIAAPGLFGSAILENRITLLPDMYRLFELAAPEWYRNKSISKSNSDLKKVLIVEDTPFFRMVERDYLTSAGYDVLEAENGKQALEILYEQKVDGVILDIVMPEMDGWQTIRAIRSDIRLKDLPVMAVTSLAEDIDPQKGFKAGFTQWEAKLNKERLLDKLSKMLEDNRVDRKNKLDHEMKYQKEVAL